MITLRIKLYKDKLDGTVDYAEPRFHPRNQLALFEPNEIEDVLNVTFAQIQEAIEKWTMVLDGSWIVLCGSYLVRSKYISDKKACINVKNKDDNCLRWAIRSARFPADNHTDRISSYPSEDGFNFDGIDAPTLIDQIKKVDKQNEIAINVFGYENKAMSTL